MGPGEDVRQGGSALGKMSVTDIYQHNCYLKKGFMYRRMHFLQLYQKRWYNNKVISHPKSTKRMYVFMIKAVETHTNVIRFISNLS